MLVPLLLLVLNGCSHKAGNAPYEGAAVYYWRTIWQLSPRESDFLHQHHIQRIYLRLFDVVKKDGVPMPDATLRFSQPLPKGCALIPVVFVSDDCLSADTTDSSLACHIADRVVQMGQTNDFIFSELQIDCDWRTSNQAAYFAFLRQLRTALSRHGSFRLSATIRLHQLRQTPPPVDYGVLMCYNTGDLTNYRTRNAVLDAKEVRFYQQSLGTYSLPLCGAYPVFRWQRLFRNRRFVSIVRDLNLADRQSFAPVSPGLYKVVKSHSVPSPDSSAFGLRLFAGDEVKQDEVPADSVLAVMHLLQTQRPGINRQVIIYSLNDKDIKRYTNEEVSAIFSAE